MLMKRGRIWWGGILVCHFFFTRVGRYPLEMKDGGGPSGRVNYVSYFPNLFLLFLPMEGFRGQDFHVE